MLAQVQWLILTISAILVLQSHGDDDIKLPLQYLKGDWNNEGKTSNLNGHSRSPQASGRGFLEWIGLGKNQDPYILQSTQQCLQGDLADCFKAQALRSFDDFFDKPAYPLSENAVLVHVESQARALAKEPPALESQARHGDSDWDGLVKYGMRKIERFLRSTALEVQLDDEVTSRGILTPRFIKDDDDKASQIIKDDDDKAEVIEGKTAPFPEVKKMIIPMLLILKLFKLKLLLFLPLILGLASVKKFLAFLALIIPGAIGYFKFCNPNSSPFSASHYSGPQYSPAGIGLGMYREPPPSYSHGHYDSNYPISHRISLDRPGGISLKELEDSRDAAYQGWEYRSRKGAEDSSIRA